MDLTLRLLSFFTEPCYVYPANLYRLLKIFSSTSSFVSSFQARMRAQKAAPSNHHPSTQASYVPPLIKQATMVLVRHDGVRQPLQDPYDGPFPVLETGDKNFKILRNGLPYTVSIDRLKAFNSPVFSQSSIVPNRSPPPPHLPPDASTMLAGPRPLPGSTSASIPPGSPKLPDVPAAATEGSSVGTVPNLASPGQFPPLPPSSPTPKPILKRRGRQSKPRVHLNL